MDGVSEWESEWVSEIAIHSDDPFITLRIFTGLKKNGDLHKSPSTSNLSKTKARSFSADFFFKTFQKTSTAYKPYTELWGLLQFQTPWT